MWGIIVWVLLATALFMLVYFLTLPAMITPKKDMAILVTGAASGIGLDTVLTLLQHTQCLVVATDISMAKLCSSFPQGNNPRLHLLELDVTSEDSVTKAAMQCKQVFHEAGAQLFSIVHSAGFSGFSFENDHIVLKPTLEEDMSIAQKLIQVNLIGVIRVNHHFWSLLDLSRHPSIVVVSSVAARVAVPPQVLYASSKHGLSGYLSGLRIEVGNRIRVKSIDCGIVDTPMTTAWKFSKHKIVGSRSLSSEMDIVSKGFSIVQRDVPLPVGAVSSRVYRSIFESPASPPHELVEQRDKQFLLPVLTMFPYRAQRFFYSLLIRWYPV